MIAVVTVTTDYATGSYRMVAVDNGHPLFGHVGGTGCMVSALIGTFIAVSRSEVLEDAVVCAAPDPRTAASTLRGFTG